MSARHPVGLVRHWHLPCRACCPCSGTVRPTRAPALLRGCHVSLLPPCYGRSACSASCLPTHRTSTHPPTCAVVPSAAGLAALEQQRQRVRSVKAQVNEIKADRAFMRAARAFNKQARRGWTSAEAGGVHRQRGWWCSAGWLGGARPAVESRCLPLVSAVPAAWHTRANDHHEAPLCRPPYRRPPRRWRCCGMRRSCTR